MEAAAAVEAAVEGRTEDFFSRFGAVSVASLAVVRPSEVRGLTGGMGEGRRGAVAEVEERGGGVSFEKLSKVVVR
jgi:hypothetical protein